MNANARDGHGTDRDHPARQDDVWGPGPDEVTRARVRRDLSELLRTLPPVGVSPSDLADWLEHKAQVMDGIAAVDRLLADHCRQSAANARVWADRLRVGEDGPQ